MEDGFCVNRVRWGFWREEHVDLALKKDRNPIQRTMKIKTLMMKGPPGR